VVALFAGEIDEPASEASTADAETTGGPPSAGVDDLFAKLRAASAEMVARDASADTVEQPVVEVAGGSDDPPCTTMAHDQPGGRQPVRSDVTKPSCR
jgi:hypothetical protein